MNRLEQIREKSPALYYRVIKGEMTEPRAAWRCGLASVHPSASRHQDFLDVRRGALERAMELAKTQKANMARRLVVAGKTKQAKKVRAYFDLRLEALQTQLAELDNLPELKPGRPIADE